MDRSTGNTIKDLWQRIGALTSEQLSDPRLPLEHIGACLEFFDLKPLQSGRKRFVEKSKIFTSDPSFKALDHDILLDLRYYLYTGEALDSTAVWAEKLLRFCEVRLNSLRQRAKEKCGNLHEGRYLMLHLAAFLLDYAEYAKDLRYLNTVLKLLDQKWLFDARSIQTGLHGKEGEVPAALLEFRLLLVTECMLGRLERGESL
jgi:hypothetical protein